MVYTSAEVCEAVGVTYRVLQYWHQKGYIPAQYRHETAGSGTPLTFDYGDVLAVAAMHALVSAGLEPRAAAKVTNGLGYDDGTVEILVDFNALHRKLEKSLPVRHLAE